jgi:hypothetical protein
VRHLVNAVWTIVIAAEGDEVARLAPFEGVELPRGRLWLPSAGGTKPTAE